MSLETTCRALALACFVVLAVGTSVSADELTLNSGERIRGDVVVATDSEVLVRLPDGTTRRIERDRIAEWVRAPTKPSTSLNRVGTGKAVRPQSTAEVAAPPKPAQMESEAERARRPVPEADAPSPRPARAQTLEAAKPTPPRGAAELEGPQPTTRREGAERLILLDLFVAFLHDCIFSMYGIPILLYFLPWLIAEVMRHPNRGFIFLINLFLGWTILGWIAALLLAVIPRQKPDDSLAPRRRRPPFRRSPDAGL